MATKLIRQIVKNPNTQNKDERRFIIVMLIFSITANFYFLTFNTGTFSSIKPILIGFTLLEIISLLFAFWNILRPARIIIPISGFIVVTLLIYMGGIHDDAIGGYYFLLIFATYLLGRWGLLTFGLLNTIAIIIIGIAETSGMITTHFGPLTDPSTVITSAFFMIAASLTLYFFVTHLSQMIEIARKNEQKQIRTNRELNKLKTILEQRVKDRTSELQALFASMQDLVIVYNQEGRYLTIASTGSDLLIKPPEDLLGRTIHEVLPKEEADKWVRHIQKVLKTHKTLHLEYFLEIDHHKVWFDASVSPMNKDTVIWVARDITDRKLLEEGFHFIGIHDNLTKLYNRTFFEEELSRLEKSRLFPISIFMIDVDQLKIINDTQGHTAGDELLQRTARVLLESFRSEDMVARIGGDEFVAILPRTNVEAAHMAIKRINYFLELNNKNDKPNDLKISIGVAICDEQGSLANTVKQADDRMYQDKRSKG